MSTQIPAAPEVPILGESDFDAKMKAFQKWEHDELQPKANDLVKEINENATNAINAASNAANNATLAGGYANTANEAANKAIEAKEYIEGYVIPEEATYNPETIEKKVRKIKIMTLSGGLR